MKAGDTQRAPGPPPASVTGGEGAVCASGVGLWDRRATPWGSVFGTLPSCGTRERSSGPESDQEAVLNPQLP